jgi:uncharacterized cupin superfamily protein
VYFEFGSVKIEGHPGSTAEYIWGDKTLRTIHCTKCGCVTHWEPLKSDPGAKHGVNLGNFDPALIKSVPVRRFDGADTWKFLDWASTAGSQPRRGEDSMSQARNSLKAIEVLDVVEPAIQTRYPKPFATLVRGRTKRKLGDHFGLETFGVNLVRMAPGCVSSVRHHHSAEDEFIYILSGTATLLTNDEELLVGPGVCAGFKAGSGQSHQLANRSRSEVVFLEVGARLESDVVVYPYDDLALQEVEGDWVFTHKDGRPYN